ncbi:unnamed protein product [Linum trigynum]|uniref:Uncharacterized protein n=1 Tax=Linum trigynum TaxID=586398 RepID=A0AAV2DA07_9ROSI
MPPTLSTAVATSLSLHRRAASLSSIVADTLSPPPLSSTIVSLSLLWFPDDDEICFLSLQSCCLCHVRSPFPFFVVAGTVESSIVVVAALSSIIAGVLPRCSASLSWAAVLRRRRQAGGKIAISFPSLHRRRRRRDSRLSLSLSHPPALPPVSSAMALSLSLSTSQKGK